MDNSITKFLEEGRRLQKLLDEANPGKKLGLSSSDSDELQKYLSASESLKKSRQLQKLVDEADLGKKLGLSTLASEELQKYLFAHDPLKGTTFPAMPIPEPIRMPHVPTFEENNEFQSAAVLLRRLATSISQWRTALPDDVQPGILAILHGGIQIDVECLTQEGFHGIRIEGQLKGSPCAVFAHQSTVQLLCFVQTVNPPETPRRSIGFIINDEESKA